MFLSTFVELYSHHHISIKLPRPCLSGSCAVSPLPNLLLQTSYLLSLCVGLSSTFHINGIKNTYINVFCIRLLSLNIFEVHLCSMCQYFVLYCFHINVHIQQLMDVLDCFHFSTIVNNASMKVCINVWVNTRFHFFWVESLEWNC